MISILTRVPITQPYAQRTTPLGQNELILASVLDCFYDSISMLLR